MGSLQPCGPFNCSTYGSRTVCNVTAQPIQQWLAQANSAGKAYGMNPVTLLALASLETNGNYSAVDPTGTTYGIVQVGQTMLDAYNCAHNSTFKLSDLVANEPNITDSSTAVLISFYIFAEYLIAVNKATNSYKLSAIGWSGAMCGYSGYVWSYGSNCSNGYPIPTATSGYGVACYQLTSAYSGWWVNPSTNQADSYYFGDLSSIPYNTLSTYTMVCFGP